MKKIVKRQNEETMNKQEMDILTSIYNSSFENQRTLVDNTGHSLGVVNRSIKNLISEGYLNLSNEVTEKAKKRFKEYKPKNAIILAAGYGMRMVPINTETPKGLLEVNGEPLIERLINQLHEVGIKEIYIVVGFMKEQYEYLIDMFGVKLIVNEDYAKKNNLHSLALVRDKLSNSYIMPCDIWADINPFKTVELYSWYMVSDSIDNESTVRVNRKMELVNVEENESGNGMIGISYLTKDDAKGVQERLDSYDRNKRYEGAFWEETLFEKDRMIILARVVNSDNVVEINTYEQLRELDDESSTLKSDAIDIICEALKVEASEVVNISVLKKGMTNRSFLFNIGEQKYIMRIPGEGTDKLINREEEAAVYKTINNKNICDNIVYINSKNGYKITEFIENSRVCNPKDKVDLTICMKRLKAFHNMKLKVNHEFDIFGQIDFYESLWDGKNSVYRDYATTKKNIFKLKKYIEKYSEKKVLTHIDAVPDNFLFTEKGDVKLIDWEYAGMQDPHVDIAMFAIYSLYEKEQIDELIDIYFESKCDKATRLKIYCYVAVCGLLWSNWCEYKRNLGIEFGEYSLRQYRYAKDFYKLVQEEQILDE